MLELKALAKMSPARMDETENLGQRIVLTGASGFIGAHLLHELRRCGHQVVAVVRPNSKTAARLPNDVEQVVSQLSDIAALSNVLRDADLIIHCAGSVRGRTRADFAAANTAALRHLSDAARHSMSHPRILLISSLAASRPHLSAYAESKFAGEQVLQNAPNVDSVILRPPAVYGPGDKEMRPLLRSIRWGLAVIVGPRNQRLSLLYVGDLATAVSAVVKQFERCKGNLFDLDDGHPNGYSWRDIIAAARGFLPVLRLPVPVVLLRLVAACNQLLSGLLKYPPMLTPGKVRELSEPSWLCDNALLNAATGWRPRVDLREGIKRTFTASQE